MLYVGNNIPFTFLRQFDIVFSFWCHFNFCAIFCPLHSEMLYYLWSVSQFSCSVMSDFLWPHGLQHTRLPCLSSSLGVCSNSCPLSRWRHPTISSSVIPFPSCLQSFPASGGQSIGASASAPVLPMNIQDWSLLGWTGWISLQSMGFSIIFSNTTVQKHQFSSAFFMVQLYYPWYFLSNGDSYPSVWKNYITLFIISSFSPLLFFCDCYLGGRLSKLRLQISYHFSPVIPLFFFLLHFLKDCLNFISHCFCSVPHFSLIFLISKSSFLLSACSFLRTFCFCFMEAIIFSVCWH